MIIGTKDGILDNMSVFLEKFPPNQRIAIKINLQSPPALNAPRTDANLLEGVITRLISLGHNVVLVEGANGHLRENIYCIGLGHHLKSSYVEILDIDKEKEVLMISRGGREYPIPRKLQEMDIRMAVPCATKRPGYLFSNNVKTFVGLLPRDLCKNGTDSIFSRPMIHENLMETISDLYEIVYETIPFHFYINGGNALSEESPLKMLPEYYCSTDPIELDVHVAKILNVGLPDYLIRLMNNALTKE